MIFPMIGNKDRLVSFIISASGVILGAAIGYAMNVSPDFTISMDDIGDTRISDDSFIIRHTVALDNVRMFKKYDHPIILEASSLDGSPLPDGLEIAFDPTGYKKVPFSSAAYIKISNMSVGSYKIKITAFGGDGNERSCPYILHVTKGDDLLV
jgi:hypothetical protein